MTFEDKRLHQPPEPWHSDDQNLAQEALVFNVAIWVFAIGLYCFDVYFMNSRLVILNYFSAFLILLGGMFMYYAYHKATDQEAKWMVDLPYNNLLFEMLAQKMPEILHDEGYDYKANELINFHYVESNQETLEALARSYTIKSKFGQDLIFEFGLTKHRQDNRTSYHFIMVMANVQMENLSTANSFAHDVNKYLKEIEFDKFERVTREPEI